MFARSRPGARLRCGLSPLNISLPDTLKSFIDKQGAGRSYGASSEYVRELIRDDQDRQRLPGPLLAAAPSAAPVPSPGGSA